MTTVADLISILQNQIYYKYAESSAVWPFTNLELFKFERSKLLYS